MKKNEQVWNDWTKFKSQMIAQVQNVARVQNIAFSRSRLSQGNFDPRRSIDDDCGYPRETQDITTEDYHRMYEREPIAARVVEVLARETWKVQPDVYETEDTENVTEFEKAWKLLGNSLRGDSLYQDEEGSPIWDYLRRVDEISGIGRFGLLLLGLDDGKELLEPAELRKGQQLTYLQVFDELAVTITAYEASKESRRYGHPTEYSIRMVAPDNLSQAGARQAGGVERVHWSRVIHVAEGDIFAKPRQQTVWNRLLDLRKLYGGSAEMYWRGALPGIAIETHPQLEADMVDFDDETLRSDIEQFTNSLQRFIRLTGASAKSLAPQVVDPTPQIEAQIQAICILLDVPKRIFMGSERGELSSTQDKDSWEEVRIARRIGYATPRIVTPLVDRLIQLGVLPAPKGYSVGWPTAENLSQSEQATVAVQRAEAMSKYVQGDGSAIMRPEDFYTKLLGFDQAEADEIVKAALEQEPLILPSDDEDEETGEEDEEIGEEDDGPRE